LKRVKPLCLLRKADNDDGRALALTRTPYLHLPALAQLAARHEYLAVIALHAVDLHV
jgi:hypothetical protein